MELSNSLITFISEEILLSQHDEPIEPETNLLLSGLVDSLSMMRLVLHIEEELGITVPPEDIILENFLSVADMIRYLEDKKEAVA